MKGADLRRYALKLLEISRKFLAEDGDLDPTAFIITAEDQLLRPIELQDEVEKLGSCKKILDEARQQKALAIITIFLARSKDFSEKEFDQESYSWSDIQHGSTDRSILLTISGPGIKNWAAALPFEVIKGKIAFRGLVEFAEGIDLGLFPGWSEQITDPRAS
jgi:hypothetical protein